MTTTRTVVLVHGAYHGAWCWDLLRAELRRRGVPAVAVELPCEEPTAGAERYAATIAAAVPAGVGPVVAVGHSLAGLTLPLLPALVPVARLVYLCALLPQPGRSFDGQNADFGTGFTPVEGAHGNADGSTSWPERGAVEMFYHDCAPELATWAARRLRPQQWEVMGEVTPLAEWPDVAATAIVAREDRVVAPDYGRRTARERLGVEALEIEGGHSPFLARPAVLADMLAGAAALG